jgi:hypothetical protein
MSLLMSETVQVFECPLCGQTINTSMAKCRYCGGSIDPQAAQTAAELTSRVSKACNDASYLRILAGSMVAFFFLRFVPFAGILGLVGNCVLTGLVPVLAIRWGIRYGKLRSPDRELRKARWNVAAAIGAWALFVAFTSVRVVMK